MKIGRSKPTWDYQKVKTIFHKSAPSVEFHINFEKLMELSKNTHNYLGKKHGTRITVKLERNVLPKRKKPVDNQSKIRS